MPQRKRTRKAKKTEVVGIKTRKFRGKAVIAKIDGEPIAEIDKLTTVAKKNKQTVFLSADLTAARPEKTLRAHRTEQEAVGRFRKRFPQITPRLSKRL